MKNDTLKSFVFLGRSGCLLPLLIILNLFFGMLFLRPLYWLILEIILVLFFIINGYILTKKIFSTTRKRENVIDVEAEVVEDKKKLE